MPGIVLEENHIFLEDDVDEEVARRLPIVLVNSSSVYREIFLHINSPGGQGIAGFKIYTALKSKALDQLMLP